MRKQFMQWVQKKKKIEPSDLFTSQGISSYAIGLAEEYLGLSVHIFEKKIIHKTKIKNNSILFCKKPSSHIVKIRSPTKEYTENINLFSTNTNCVNHQRHLTLISDSAVFSKKQFCQQCGRSFKRTQNLARHKNTECTKSGRFLPEKTISHPEPIAATLQELFPSHMLKKDDQFVLVKCEINSKKYQLHIDFICGNKSIFQTVYGSESLLHCADFLAGLLQCFK